MRTILLIILAFGLMPLAHAQSTPEALLLRVNDAYRHAAYLGFHLQYSYANDGKPDQPVDTLSGDLYMDKGRSRFVLGNTVSLLSGVYALQVLPEQKLLYLSKAPLSSVANPLSMLDSLTHRLDKLATDVATLGALKVLTIHLPPGAPYVRVRLSIDTLSGYLREVTYDLYTAGFVSPNQIDRPGHQGPYGTSGRVTIAFSQYQSGRFGDEAFDTGKYFTRTGDRFEPTVAYKDYHIFLASSHY